MKLIGKNHPHRDSLSDALRDNSIEYEEKELQRDIHNNAIFLVEYTKDGKKRMAIELMQMAAMDDPWFQSYVWEVEEGETPEPEQLWGIMKEEIEEERRNQ